MRMVDLFSGIGGFSLAATWVWGDSLDIVCFCEKDPFCQKVLHKHWPTVPIVEDVNDLEQIIAYATSIRSESRRAECARQQRHVTPNSGNISVDLIVGGWPCQPASCAGQRKGTEDDRWLWPPLLAAIREITPRWLLLENVPGLLSLEAGLVFERCCLDLEAEGYEVQPLLIPACGVNAPHRRERLWIVANSNQQRPQVREVQPGTYEKNARPLSETLGTNTGYKLQPGFALWMMGYPEDWCDLDGE